MRRRLITSTISVAMLGGLACDIPTDAPHLEQTWIVPVRELVIAVKELLPASADTANGAIVVTPDPVTRSEEHTSELQSPI